MTPDIGGNDEVEPIYVYGAGCNGESCSFHRAAENVVEIIFSPRHTFRTGYARVEIYGDDDWITVSSKVSMCPQLKVGRCPLTWGQLYNYPSIVRVPDDLQSGTLTTVRIRAFNRKNATIACTQIAARII